MTAEPQTPRTPAYCPCGGQCHHDTSPCSLGCWAAQKPWRPEEAAAKAQERITALEGALDRLIEAADHTHRMDKVTAALCSEVEFARDVLSGGSLDPAAREPAGLPEIDVERLREALWVAQGGEFTAEAVAAEYARASLRDDDVDRIVAEAVAACGFDQPSDAADGSGEG